MCFSRQFNYDLRCPVTNCGARVNYYTEMGYYCYQTVEGESEPREVAVQPGGECHNGFEEKPEKPPKWLYRVADQLCNGHDLMFEALLSLFNRRTQAWREYRRVLQTEGAVKAAAHVLTLDSSLFIEGS
jgi:hypothetical protein